LDAVGVLDVTVKWILTVLQPLRSHSTPHTHIPNFSKIPQSAAEWLMTEQISRQTGNLGHNSVRSSSQSNWMDMERKHQIWYAIGPVISAPRVCLRFPFRNQSVSNATWWKVETTFRTFYPH